MANETKLPPFPGGIIIRVNPKVLDSFFAHKTDIVKHKFRRKNTDLAVISGGLTSHLQPLDASLNKPFKAKVISFLMVLVLSK
ncbi:15308_t:CDS:2 [Funneliformis geosporum]|uniref:15308_t:CDS:1 n=1 Tax=Funneliformis geosporum TaxID=1117311 RepID=A0A9W4SXA6_9GLOM|nr:15308_t:CDS:2 [Funneliformis geosporum]